MRPGSFEGLRASHFDAYLPEKWASNVYTRERLDAKQCLLNLARALEPVFVEHGLVVQRYATDEHPSLWNQQKVDAQWVFFWRTEEDRKILEAQVDLERTLASTLADPTPMTRHAFMCLNLDQNSFKAGFQLHYDAWVDRSNLENKLAQTELREELGALVRSLPEPIFVCLSGKEPIPAAECSAESLAGLMDEFPGNDEGVLEIGISLNRQDTFDLGNEIASFLAERMAAVADVYRFVAWTEENNHIGSDERFIESRAARGARREKLDAEVERRRTALEEKKRGGAETRKELEEVFRREVAFRASQPRRPRPRPPEQRETPRNKDEEKRPSASEAPRSKPKPRPSPVQAPPPPKNPAEPIPVEAGHQARVAKGPFAGQVGVVQEVDAKGMARVMVGFLATRLHIDELIGLGPAPSASSSTKK